MTNYRSAALGVVTFAVLFYFFLLPLLTSGLEFVKTMASDYLFKLLNKLKVVGIVLAGTTVLYFTQAALKRIDRESIKKKLQSLLPKRAIKKGADDEDKPINYPLQKVFLVASEMLSTEESYVNELKIIQETFRVRIENEGLFSADVIKAMFSNIGIMYRFHQKFLLPSLQDRMKAWEEKKDQFSPDSRVDDEWPDQKIGDIFVKHAPHLKMYSDYIENFDNAMNTIDKQRKKNKKFAAIMDEIQATPELHRLSLQHHMLSPVQRIPRYKLLLQDYVKRLPENSSDLEQAKKALELVENAASHSNETMKRIERLKKIIEVQEMLGRKDIELSSPSREFVKEGKVSKISATKVGDSLKESLKDMDRYLFLFNDLLLLCSWNSLTKRVRGFAKFKLKMKFEFDSLVINENVDDDEENERAFSISHSSSPKSMKIDLLARTAAEKEEWIHAISKALKSFNERKAELKASGIQHQESYESKNSLEDAKSNPLFLLNDDEYEDSDAPNFDTHEDDFAEQEDGEDDNSGNDTSENGVMLRSSKRSPNSRSGVKSLSLGRNKSPSPMQRMKKKNSVLF